MDYKELINNTKKEIQMEERNRLNLRKESVIKKQEILNKAYEDISIMDEKYQNLHDESLNKTDSLKQKLRDLNKYAIDVTTFDSEMIGDMIAKLVSEMEGEEYVYCTPDYLIEILTLDIYGYEQKKNLYTLSCVLRKELKRDRFLETKNSSESLKTPTIPDLIILSYHNLRKLSLYNELDRNNLDNKFSYILDFINEIINASLENKEQLSEQQLEILMNDFISKNKVKKLSLKKN